MICSVFGCLASAHTISSICPGGATTCHLYGVPYCFATSGCFRCTRMLFFHGRRKLLISCPQSPCIQASCLAQTINLVVPLMPLVYNYLSGLLCCCKNSFKLDFGSSFQIHARLALFVCRSRALSSILCWLKHPPHHQQ